MADELGQRLFRPRGDRLVNGGFRMRRSSLLHRLNPLTKLIAITPILFFVTMTTDPWTPLLLVVVNAAAAMLVGGASPAKYARKSLPMLIIGVGVAAAYPFLVSSRVTEGSPILLSVGGVDVHEAGVVYGAAAALRLLAIFSLTFVFVATTELSDFIQAMMQQWKVSSRFGYGVLAVCRFVPDLQKELRTIQAAHRVRGMLGDRRIGGLAERVRRYMLPLLAAAIRRAERTAHAMDARGFGSSKPRTFYRPFRFAARDWFGLAVYWLIIAVAVATIYEMDYMGDLSFFKLYG